MIYILLIGFLTGIPLIYITQKLCLSNSPKLLCIPALNSVLWVLYYFKYGISVNTALMFLYISLLIILSFMDLHTHTVNLGIIVLIGILAIPSFFLTDTHSLTDRLSGALIIPLTFLIVNLFSKGIGIGDIAFLLASGLLIGFKNIFIGTLIGLILICIVGIILKLVFKKTTLALVPWLSIGIIFCILM